MDFDNTSTTSYSTQSSVSSSRKISKDSKTTVTTIKTQFSTSSRTTTVTTNKDQNYNTTYSKASHNINFNHAPTAVLPVFPRALPQTSPNRGKKLSTPGSPKEFKPRKEAPVSNGISRSEIIAQRKMSKSAGRTHEPTSGCLNDWNSKFIQTKGDQSKASSPKALDIFKRLESQGTSSSPSIGSPSTSHRDAFGFPNVPSRNSMDSTVSTDRSSMGSIPPEVLSPTFSGDHYVSNQTDQNMISDHSSSLRTPREVRVEVEETPKTKVFKIATELLTTEREYVRVLGLIEMASKSL